MKISPEDIRQDSGIGMIGDAAKGKKIIGEIEEMVLLIFDVSGGME